MRLTRLQVRHVRILDSVRIEADRGLNVIQGANASGKSSLLEAIHLLGLGRSFRTRKTREVVTRDQTELLVFGEGTEKGITHRLGIRKAVNERTEIHVDGQRVKSASELAGRLPLVVITPESHSLVSGGPSQRRAMVDWGVFHVEHAFYSDWLVYHRALKQRNALLKQSATPTDLKVWEREMAGAGERIAARRAVYLEQLEPHVARQLERLTPGLALTIALRHGWEREQPLGEALEAARNRDRKLGFTSVGPHRADLSLITGGRPAAETVSRGQQKLLVLALRLAQLETFREATGRSAVVLIDDLPAELDRDRRKQLLSALALLDVQVFVSATDAGLVDVTAWESSKMFHVEQGVITEVV